MNIILKFALMLFLFVGNQIFSQANNPNSGYFALHGGNYSIFSKNYQILYGSKPGFIIGSDLGISLSSKLSLAASVSYFQKEFEYIPDDNTELQENNILKQLILDVGIDINTFPQSIVDLYLQTGVTIAMIDEERKNTDGEFIYEIEGNGNFGVYAGGTLELNLGKSPISIFSSYRFYYSWKPLLTYNKTYSAHKIIFGLRLYFSDRW